MWFGILGHLSVRAADGTDVPIPGPARRQVLAALLCRPGAVVTMQTLVEDLWGSVAPRSAVGSLRSHIVRLRAALAQGGEENLLLTVGDGYRLNISPRDVDAGEFEALVGEAGRTTDPNAAIERYDRALALWRDEPYVEFGDAPFAVLERIRLSEMRAMARERRTDLALGTGTAGDLVGDLEQRVHAEPYRERGWEQLALALYRSGRQADALSACRRARQVLLDDLGVDPGPGLQTLEQRLLRQDPELLASAPPPAPAEVFVDRCPYLGLAGYEEQDAALFVGRERLTSMLAGRLADQSVVVVTGASGVGKSSLVRAGLVPALRAGALPGSSAWRIEVRTPGTDVLSPDHRRPDLLVLDQAEELFTGLDPAERADVVRRLAGYLEDDHGRLVIVLRSDFYGRLADLDSLAPYAEKTAILVGPMRADELRRALVEPASRAGLRLEDELVETIMDDVVGEPEPLPLLSEAMVRTWERRAGDLLTLDGYERSGELAGALEAAAEECYCSLDEESQRATRQLLVRMTARVDTGWIRRSVPRSEPRSSAEQVALTALIAARLVVTDRDRIELSHEALLAHWPRLRGWLEERTFAAELLQHLEQAAREWQAAGRQDSDLYRGPRLSAAVEWRAEHPEDLSPAEDEFLEASARAAQAELSAARRQTRRLRMVAIGLAVVVVVAVATAVLAVKERSSARSAAARAERAALSADARRLAALSANAPDVATSSLLAAAAYRLQDTPDTRGALLGAVERSQSAVFSITTRFRPQQVLVSPDGRLLYSIDQRRNVDVYDVATRRHVTRYLARATDLDGLASGGSQLAVSGQVPGNDPVGERRISVLSSQDGTTVRVLTTGMNPDAAPPKVSADGRWLGAVLLGKASDTFAIYRASDWAAPPREIPLGHNAIGLAAGASSFAVELDDGTLETIDAATGRIVHRVLRPQLLPNDQVAFAASPDGSRIATVARADELTPIVVDLAHPAAAPVRLPSQPQGVGAIAFAPGGEELAVSSEAGGVAVYGTADGHVVATYAGQASSVHTIAWAGTTRPTALYTGGLDGRILSWSLAATPRLMRLSGPVVDLPDHAEPFGHLLVGATPNQRLGPSGGAESLYRLDMRTGGYESWPLGPDSETYVNQAVASADGRYAVVSVQDPKANWRNQIEIWDLRRGRQVGALHVPAKSVLFQVGLNAAISPDGKTAVSSLDMSRVGVFDVPSGRLVRTFVVHFAGPDANRVFAIPWQFDPAGRLVVAGFDSGPPQAAPPGAPPGKPADAADQRLALVDATTGRMLAQTGLGDITGPSAIGWSHDGKLLALGTYVGTLRLLDAATLKPVADAGSILTAYVLSASFSPDDRSLVVGDTSGAFEVFSVPDLSREGTRVQAGNAGDAWVFAFYNPAGDIVGLAPSRDGEQWFRFPARASELMSAACHLVGADITRQQWARYVGDQPYRHVCPS